MWANVNIMSCYFTTEPRSYGCIWDPPGVPGLVFAQVHADTKGIWCCLWPLSEIWGYPKTRGHMMEIYKFLSSFHPQSHLCSSTQLPARWVQQGDVLSVGGQGGMLSRRVYTSRFPSISTSRPVQTGVQPSDCIQFSRERPKRIQNCSHHCWKRNPVRVCVCVSAWMTKQIIDLLSGIKIQWVGCPETVFVCISDQITDMHRGHMTCLVVDVWSSTYLCTTFILYLL